MIRRRMKVLVDREINAKPMKLVLFNYDRACFKCRGYKEEEIVTKFLRFAVNKYDIPIEKILGDPIRKKKTN